MAAAAATDRAPAPAPAPAPAGRSQAVLVVVALAVTAGVIHAVAMVSHFGEWWAYGAFFLVVMCAQLGWAAWLYRHPAHRRVLVLGAVAGLAIIGVWVLTRTAGVPIGPEAGGREGLGVMDVMASLDQLVTAGLVTTIVAPASGVGRRLTWMAGPQSVRLGSIVCSVSLFAVLLAGHSH